MRRSPLRRARRLVVRGGSRFPKRRCPDFLAWVRTLPCLLADRGGCLGIIIPAHVKTRGAGGDDVGNVVPLCVKHHDEQHHGIQSFEAKYGLDLAARAEGMGLWWKVAIQ